MKKDTCFTKQVLLQEMDFYDLENKPPLPVYDNPALYGDSVEREKIEIPSAKIITNKAKSINMSIKELPKAALLYLKTNWIFLASIFIIWITLGVWSYGQTIYKIPIISQIYKLLTSKSLGKILVYLTATYNGPVGFFDGGLTPYTFLVAVTGKSAYLLAMTGVVIPSIKSFIRNKDNEMLTYRKSANKLIDTIKSLKKSVRLLGFSLAGGGMALAASNLLTRNGKIDKTFVLILLSFVLFKGLSGVLPSAIDFIARRIMALFTRFMPGGVGNGFAEYQALRTGGILGFASAVLIGSLGENAGYILGALLILGGIITSVIKKESQHGSSKI